MKEIVGTKHKKKNCHNCILVSYIVTTVFHIILDV